MDKFLDRLDKIVTVIPKLMRAIEVLNKYFSG